MDNIGCFLKFNRRCFLERLQEGHVFFTTAKRMREEEKKRQERGIGDSLEGGMILTNGPMLLTDCYGRQAIVGPIKFTVEPLDNVPVFCVLACNKADCVDVDSEHFVIKLPNEVREWFEEHFSEYDAVAVIKKPSVFANDIVTALGSECIHRRIDYVNRDASQKRENASHPLTSFLNAALHQDKSKPNTWYGTVDDSMNLLLEKDLFFKQEREYRFIQPALSLDSPKEFDVVMHSPIEIISLDDLWNEKPISKE